MNIYILGLLGLVLTLVYLWRHMRLYKIAYQLKGPMGYPLIGSAHSYLDATKVVEELQQHGRKFGNLSKLWMGNHLFIYVEDPSHIEAILNSPICLNKGASYRFIENFLGMGLITMHSEAWKVHRKLLNPSFHYNIVNKFVPIFNKHLRTMISNLMSRTDVQFDIHENLKNCSMDMICETTMDRLTNAQSGGNEVYLAAIHKVLEIAGCRMFNPLLQPKPLFRISKYYNIEAKSLSILKSTVEDIIDTKSNEINATKTIQSQQEENLYGKEKHIFIDRVLRLIYQDKSFSREEALNETNTILLAGYETTATTSAFIMLMLAMNPQYQEVLYQELESIVLSDTDDITNEDTANLKFLDMFIKETLRLFPSVPYLTRTTSSDFEVGGYKIPPGVEFVMSCISMHRSEKHFKNPEVFDPNNFLPENVAERHPQCFIPFSAGPRNCIGMRYANSVLRIITVYVVKNFTLSTSLKMEDLKYRMNITLNLMNTHLVTIKRRTKAA